MAEVIELTGPTARRAAKAKLKQAAEMRLPEQKLILAVILDGVDDLGAAGKRKDDAERYFLCGAFSAHAYVVGLEPEYVVDVLVGVGLLERRGAATAA